MIKFKLMEFTLAQDLLTTIMFNPLPPPPQSLQTPPQPVPQAPFTHSLTTLLLKTLSNQTLTFHSLAQVTPTNHNRPRTLFQHPLFQLQLRPLRPLRLTLNFLNFLITMIKLLILLILHKIQIRIQSQCWTPSHPKTRTNPWPPNPKRYYSSKLPQVGTSVQSRVDFKITVN